MLCPHPLPALPGAPLTLSALQRQGLLCSTPDYTKMAAQKPHHIEYKADLGGNV